MELIRLEDIHKTYHLGEIDVPVLKGISLTIQRGEMVALMGASGSGKTTLMNILGCLDRPTAGRFWLDGQEMSRLTPNQRALVRTEKLGFVFQSFNLLARTTAVHNVLMPLDYSPRAPGSAEARLRATILLDRVGLADRFDHEPSQMSGGQQQRVAIARSLINQPALVLADEPTGNLDSHTSVEILHMFQQLNAEGITVILVTHDPKVAAYAHRTIRISDGLIEGDERSAESQAIATAVEAVPQAGQAGQKPAAADSARHRSSGGSSLSIFPPTIRTALGALQRNKMRSALTALGVIIGVTSVIAMTEIGEGSKIAIQESIGKMGANNILVLPGAATSSGVSFGSGSVQTLTPEDADAILKECPSVSDVAPVVRARTQVVYNNRNWNTNSITGTTPSYLNVRDWGSMDEGDVFTERDVRNRNKVCLLGQSIRRELFQDESPIGKEVRIQNVSFRVIGVLPRKGANMMGMDQDDIVIAPWTTIKYHVSGNSAATQTATTSASTTSNQVNSLNNLYPGATAIYPALSPTQAADTPQPIRFVTVDQFYAKARSTEEIPQAIEQITTVLRERHHIQSGRDDDFNIRDMTELTKTLSSTSQMMSVLLLIVAGISLVVGGVGIMNIMLVSVTERTREIGLRMAVGARGHHILRQFLVEAVVLCLLGGGVGILFGRGASMMVQSIMRWPTAPSLPAIIAAVVVSAGVGILFGFYPAWKASRLDPIEALRYE
jgi:macrolide transport system ATP-binding/permease protein